MRGHLALADKLCEWFDGGGVLGVSKHSMGRVVRQKSERDSETARRRRFSLYVTGTRIVCELNQFTRGRHALLCGPRFGRSIRSVEACVARGWICGFVDQLKKKWKQL